MLFLLDTDTCIDVLRGVTEVVDRLAAVSPDDCAISTITTFELRTGIEKCRQPARERRKVEALISAIHELPFQTEAAAAAAQIRAQLEAAGTPLGPYDTLLAGHATSLGLTIVTSNVSEYQRVPSLQWANWRSG